MLRRVIQTLAPAARLWALALAGTVAAFPAAAQAPEAQPVVRVSDGVLAGVSIGRIAVFKGIPYAAPPVGQLRWRPPQPALRWTGVRTAAAFGSACLQPTGDANLAGDPGPVSEDCLTLNVWAPRGAHHLPVMVWVHGGGTRYGSSSQPYYDGAPFARDGVVFVSMNYRLAGLGFFAHPALTREAGPGAPLGNYGLMDQLAALAWVKRNVAAFGGDPRNVTVFGESSSAVDVLAMMATPAGAGLFQKAIVESSCDWDDPTTLPEREADGLRMAAEAGAPGAEVDPARLRALPATEFLDAGFKYEFAPFVDGRLLPRSTTRAFAEQRTAAVRLMLGSNSYEGAAGQNLDSLRPLARQLAALYPDSGEGESALRQLDTDRFFGAPCRWIAGQNARKAPTFLYRFSYLPTAARGLLPGAPHGAELGYVFDDLDRLPALALMPFVPAERRAAFVAAAHLGASPEDLRMARQVHGCWVGFARTGRPSCRGAPAWPRYLRARDQLMDFAVRSVVRSHVRAAQDDALERLVLPALLSR